MGETPSRKITVIGSIVPRTSDGAVARVRHEQQGRRPALVVSVEALQSALGLAMVCAIATHGGRSAGARNDLEVPIPPGLPVHGVVLQVAPDGARSIDTLVELLQGQLSTSVMERITRPGTGLFPSPAEISFSCNCPDSAAMCKHVAATLYGIGARLDSAPELLFGFRKVDAKELIARVGEGGTPVQKLTGAGRILDSSKLADVFGIDFDAAEPKSSHKPIGKKKKSVAPREAKSANRLGKRSAERR
jgi:mRNA-degrading endonuclease toxin of MazEF toxin-antitoxin module